MTDKCKNCGSNKITDGKCEYCGTLYKQKLEKIKSDMGNFKELKDTHLIGDMNNIDYAENCIIEGDMNNIKQCINTQVIGDMNDCNNYIKRKIFLNIN